MESPLTRDFPPYPTNNADINQNFILIVLHLSGLQPVEVCLQVHLGHGLVELHQDRRLQTADLS